MHTWIKAHRESGTRGNSVFASTARSAGSDLADELDHTGRTASTSSEKSHRLLLDAPTMTSSRKALRVFPTSGQHYYSI